MKSAVKYQVNNPRTSTASLSISVRSYKESDQCVILARSIASAYAHARNAGHTSILKSIYWFDNSPRSESLKLRRRIEKVLGSVCQVHWLNASNDCFSYWKSASDAILTPKTTHVCILSGHCILTERVIDRILVNISNSSQDVFLLPTGINPLMFPSLREFSYIKIYNSILFQLFSQLLNSNSLASLPFSNSNAVYRVDSVRKYPIPMCEGGEDAVWITKHPVNFRYIRGAQVLHSHKPTYNLQTRTDECLAEIESIYASSKRRLFLFRMQMRIKKSLYLLCSLCILCTLPSYLFSRAQSPLRAYLLLKRLRVPE